MKIHQLRNATAILSIGPHRLLLDPMFSDPGSLPGFRMRGGERRRNPLVPLPAGIDAALEEVTGVLITHEHLDHLDSPARKWIRQRQLPVWASSVDVPNLHSKGLDAREVLDNDLGLGVEVIPARHGRGLLGWLMGPVSGFYLVYDGEPSLYITADSILDDGVRDVLATLRPELVLAPAGSANFGFGSDILFSEDELVELTRLSPGQVIFHHLESIDHCPTTRKGLRQRLDAEGLGEKVYIPEDGAVLEFSSEGSEANAPPRPVAPRKPGFQKWVASKMG
ncbi:MAG: MBL fold metallo-hydrolase [Acidobacteriota bacterium]